MGQSSRYDLIRSRRSTDRIPVGVQYFPHASGPVLGSTMPPKIVPKDKTNGAWR